MNNEQNNNQPEESKIVPGEENKGILDTAKKFIATTPGKIVYWGLIAVVVVVFVLLKVGARSHNISKHSNGVFGSSNSAKVEQKKAHGSAQAIFNRQCKLANNSPEARANGAKCIGVVLSEDSKNVVVTYQITKDEVAKAMEETVANNKEAVVNSMKAAFCAQKDTKRVLDELDSMKLVYQNKSKKEILAVEISDCD